MITHKQKFSCKPKFSLRWQIVICNLFFLFSNSQLWASFQVTPKQILIGKRASDKLVFKKDQFYLTSDQELNHASLCHLRVGKQVFSIPARRISPRIFACVMTKALEVSWNEDNEISIALENNEGRQALGLKWDELGAMSPINGRDMTVYWMNPQHNIIHGMMSIEGDFTIEDARSFIRRLVTSPKLERFRMRARVAGYPQPFWDELTENRLGELAQHLMLVKLDATKRPEEQLKSLVEELLTTSLSEARPLWELWLVQDYNEDGQRKSILLVRCHHMLSDGIGLILSLFKAGGVNIDEVSYPGKKLHYSQKHSQQGSKQQGMGREAKSFRAKVSPLLKSPLPPGLSSYKALSLSARLFYQQLASPSEPSWSPFQVAQPITHSKVAWLKTPHAVSDIKKVSKAFGTGFSDVVYSMLSGAMRMAILEGEDEKGSSFLKLTQKQLHAYISVSLRRPQDLSSKGDIIANKAWGLRTPLFLEQTDEGERLEKIAEFNRRLKKGPGLLLATLSMRFFSKFPWLLGKERIIDGFSHMYTSVISNVPGPEDPVYIDSATGKQRISEIRFFLPGCVIKHIPLIFSGLSYDGHLHLAVSVTSQLNLNPERLLQYSHKVLAILKDQAALKMQEHQSLAQEGY